jgi:hypothetical protein
MRAVPLCGRLARYDFGKKFSGHRGFQNFFGQREGLSLAQAQLGESDIFRHRFLWIGHNIWKTMAIDSDLH